jgi:hypothetical protein
MDKKTKLEKEIKDLETKLSKDHFGELFNKTQHKKDLNRLQKLKKELEILKTKK